MGSSNVPSPKLQGEELPVGAMGGWPTGPVTLLTKNTGKDRNRRGNGRVAAHLHKMRSAKECERRAAMELGVRAQG